MTKKRSYWISILLASIFFLLFSFVTIKFFFQSKRANDDFIADQIILLDQIFKKINQSCKIIGFKHLKDHIDFLTVKKFQGSTIGSMLLAHPENWQGPYIDKEITVEGRDLQIVRTKNGYYIIPGDGISLSNGQIINKTFKINIKTDIDAMIANPRYLLSNGRQLAVRIQMSENPNKKKNDELIADQIEQLSKIFTNINKTCQITGFRHERDHIDFLNVKEFVGSIVGCMNLVNPKQWEGPYLKQNLTVDGKLYQIVSTNRGYFILPDDGIEFANEQIMGQTLTITKEADIEMLMRDPKALSTSSGRPMAARIPTVRNGTRTLDKGKSLEEESELL